MTVHELSREQLNELKQDYLAQHLLEVEDRTPSYEELANAPNTVADWLIFDNYGGVAFTDDDFCCTASIPQF